MVRERVIIVGASSGIGHEIACKYVKQGCKVGITGRRIELLQNLQRVAPEQVEIACFDVTAPGNIQEIQNLISQLGGLDLLIYCAGFGHPKNELDIASEVDTTRTNVNGFVEIASYAFNFFVEKGSGQIAVISSVAALRGNHLAPAYSASKAFLSNYAEGLNLKAQLLKKAIVVTDVRPGFVKTKPATHNQFWASSVEKAAGQICHAIEKKKRVVYISRRWQLVAWIYKFIPFWLYRRLL